MGRIKSVIAVAELEMQKRAVGEYEKRYFYQQYTSQVATEYQNGILTVGDFFNPPADKPYIDYIRRQMEHMSSLPSATIKNDFNKLQQEIKADDFDKMLVDYADFAESHPYVEDLSQSKSEYHI